MHQKQPPANVASSFFISTFPGVEPADLLCFSLVLSLNCSTLIGTSAFREQGRAVVFFLAQCSMADRSAVCLIRETITIITALKITMMIPEISSTNRGSSFPLTRTIKLV